MHFIFEGQFSGVILGAFTGVEGTRTKGLLTKLMGAEVREATGHGEAPLSQCLEAITAPRLSAVA